MARPFTPSERKEVVACLSRLFAQVEQTPVFQLYTAQILLHLRDSHKIEQEECVRMICSMVSEALRTLADSFDTAYVEFDEELRRTTKTTDKIIQNTFDDLNNKS